MWAVFNGVRVPAQQLLIQEPPSMSSLNILDPSGHKKPTQVEIKLMTPEPWCIWNFMPVVNLGFFVP